MSKVRYCRECGLMRMPGETVCPKCGAEKTTARKPEPTGMIHHIGITNFTRYCGNREVV